MNGSHWSRTTHRAMALLSSAVAFAQSSNITLSVVPQQGEPKALVLEPAVRPLSAPYPLHGSRALNLPAGTYIATSFTKFQIRAHPWQPWRTSPINT